MRPVKDGSLQEESVPVNRPGSEVSCTLPMVRCNGGRKAQPYGATRPTADVDAADSRGGSPDRRSGLSRCQGHRTVQRSSLRRVLIAAISLT
jgi:hypothetical protein